MKIKVPEKRWLKILPRKDLTRYLRWQAESSRTTDKDQVLTLLRHPGCNQRVTNVLIERGLLNWDHWFEFPKIINLRKFKRYNYIPANQFREITEKIIEMGAYGVVCPFNQSLCIQDVANMGLIAFSKILDLGIAQGTQVSYFVGRSMCRKPSDYAPEKAAHEEITADPDLEWFIETYMMNISYSRERQAFSSYRLSKEHLEKHFSYYQERLKSLIHKNRFADIPYCETAETKVEIDFFVDNWTRFSKESWDLFWYTFPFAPEDIEQLILNRICIDWRKLSHNTHCSTEFYHTYGSELNREAIFKEMLEFTNSKTGESNPKNRQAELTPLFFADSEVLIEELNKYLDLLDWSKCHSVVSLIKQLHEKIDFRHLDWDKLFNLYGNDKFTSGTNILLTIALEAHQHEIKPQFFEDRLPITQYLSINIAKHLNWVALKKKTKVRTEERRTVNQIIRNLKSVQLWTGYCAGE